MISERAQILGIFTYMENDVLNQIKRAWLFRKLALAKNAFEDADMTFSHYQHVKDNRGVDLDIDPYRLKRNLALIKLRGIEKKLGFGHSKP